MKMADAKQKRNEQLKRWLGSETDLEPPLLKKKKTKVKFDEGAVFLAACSSGDTEEVLRMLDRGADINYANVDGLTALHQACIDDNVDMVTFLVEHGAGVNQPDNEGWIPLHAAASCGYMDIAQYLIGQGAHVGVVNSEGETPLDIAEEEAMEELLQNEINRQGRAPPALLRRGFKSPPEVLKLLIQAGYDVNIKDYDGWTPLHAAAHWGKEESCRILVDNLCDMDAINKVGQTAFDVADEDVLGYLEELQKKQTLLVSEKRDVKKSPLIETTTTADNNQILKPLKSEETVLLVPEKVAPRIESLEQEKADEEEEEEGKKDESSCSSEEEEEEDSESETEAEKNKPTSSTNSTPSAPPSVTVSSPTTPTNQVTPTSPVKKSDFVAPLVGVTGPSDPALWRKGLRKTGISLVPKKPMQAPPSGKASSREDDRKDESPSSWRLGLRKTGSYGALAEIAAAKEAQKEKDVSGVMRSASSPRLSSTLDNKDKDKEKEKEKNTRLAYVAPTIPTRRFASTSDADEKENRDSAASLVRSGSYTRRRWDDDAKNSEGTASQNRAPSYQRSTSHSLAIGRSSSVRDVPAKSSSATSLDPNACNAKPWQSPSSQYSIYRSSSFGRRVDDALGSSTTSSTTTSTSSSITSPSGTRSLLSGTGSGTGTSSSSSRTGSSSITSRFWTDDSADKESAAVIPTVVNTASTTTTTSSTSTVPSSDGRERRRSYLTPVRDEESESQRRARSRQARQSRRSTQGVTLTDLQEAEKTIGRSRQTRAREEEKEKEEKEKQDKEKQEEKKEAETKEDDYRSRYRSYEETYQRYRPSSTSSAPTPASSASLSSSGSSLNRPNSLSGITSAYPSQGRTSRETQKELDKKEEEKEGEDKSQPRSIRDRRRPREKRRSTGVSFWTQDSDENDPDRQSDSEEGSNRSEAQSDRLSRGDSGLTGTSTERYERGYSEGRRPYLSRLERDDTTDYKKLYEQILAENEKLKAQLRDSELEQSDLKLQLEKATQRQERIADRSQLEMEKRERRALERKISEMEEELKTLPDLKADNQRLKDENGALIRVISKLSK
ncbi:protein phosphatase 1 regulatory subunit 12A [Anguilla rostrata]|uniref:protein phosphatase 1 regulatory subunit 12A n=1 Tax=Anguilla rostrata TaxID=7938 RepID=UPI0030D18384